MKKIFTLIAGLLLVGGGNLFAQEVVDLSAQTVDQENCTTSEWKFNGTNITIKIPGDNRLPGGKNSAAPIIFPKENTGVDREYQGLNIANNATEIIALPDGIKLYKIEIFGWSQGDNFEYIYAYGSGDNSGFEWVEPKGNGVKDNAEILTCKFPMDPCNYKGSRVAGSTKSVGYCIASLDFTDEPYEGEFPIAIAGNNQSDFNFRLFLSKEAAEASKRATGDDPTGNFDEPGWVSIDTAIKALAAENTNDAAIYNIAGQKVDASYKGLVIKNGKKYIVK